MICQHLSEDIAFIGPPLSEGALPAVFYFSLSAKESLGLDPFNQPAVYLTQFPLRVFSISLPYHNAHFSPKEALSLWATQSLLGQSVIDAIVEKTRSQINFLLKEKLNMVTHLNLFIQNPL